MQQAKERLPRRRPRKGRPPKMHCPLRFCPGATSSLPGIAKCFADPTVSPQPPRGAPEAFRGVLEPCWAPLAERPRAAAVGRMFTQGWMEGVDIARYRAVVCARPDPDDAGFHRGA
eukprot:TRINITY_DN17101_c0_g1_i4.p3 TRINITY_DN17101_c0_g1~~TRINITY_DN17101_c0_g1_i4.p3  ORF type:complete len:116 (+),score=0.99 TRINITY_DN17101_c0_g1_i4:84-431(+)